MTRSILLGSSLALSAVLAVPAAADVSAADVWANQQAYVGAFGLRLTGTLEGDTLTAPKAVAIFPMGLGSFELTGDDIEMRDAGDGTVSISYPSPYGIDFSGFVEDGGTFSGRLLMTHSGYDIAASGEPGDVTYETTGTDLRLEMQEFTLSGDMNMDLSGIISVDQFTSSNRVTEGDMLTLASNSETGTTQIQVIVTDADAGVISTSEQTVQPTSTSLQAAMPTGGIDLFNLSAALRDGLSIDLSTEGEGTSSEDVTMMDGDLFSRQITNIGSQTSRIMLDASGLSLSGTGNDMAFEIEQPFMMPMPISFAMADVNMDIKLPLNASDDAQSFRVLMGLEGITLDEELWALFDPMGSFDRGPADFVLDVSGEGTLGIDLLDFEALEDVEGVPPIEVSSVSLDTLRLTAVGAEATAEGAATFDWTDFTTIPGIARPEGQVTINATGVNALLDTLIEMGFVGPDDAMGARMMMGIFAEAVGEDAIRSVLEINAEGQVFANGQRLQ